MPARTLLEAPERWLRIAVAHECGHFQRRWISLFARSELARLHEEVQADRVALQLTGATLDELDAAVRAIAQFEPGWDEDTAAAYLGLRRQLLRTTPD
ncbi:MAG TPA: hypothetical protein VGD46_18635 [Rhizobacter sp.]